MQLMPGPGMLQQVQAEMTEQQMQQSISAAWDLVSFEMFKDSCWSPEEMDLVCFKH